MSETFSDNSSQRKAIRKNDSFLSLKRMFLHISAVIFKTIIILTNLITSDSHKSPSCDFHQSSQIRHQLYEYFSPHEAVSYQLSFSIRSFSVTWFHMCFPFSQCAKRTNVSNTLRRAGELVLLPHQPLQWCKHASSNLESYNENES